MPDVPTAKRKPHSKSRRGCLQCKQRHTKCNETHPQCANCIRLRISCTWPASRSTGSPYSSGAEHRVSNLLYRDDTAHRPNSGPQTLALDDMRLLHHWTTKISYDGSPSPEWSINAVEVAFEHPFLLHGLLALSALHKTLDNPEFDRTSLLAQADAHMSSALVDYRKNLQNLSPDTALPMFLLAATLFAYNLASAQIEEPESPIDALLHCFRLLRGIREVSGPYWKELVKSPIVEDLLSGVTNIDDIAVPKSGDAEFKEIADLEQLVELIDIPDREVCTEAVRALHLTSLKTQTAENEKHARNIFMTWPAQMTDAFLNLLEAHHPVAVIAVTYFSVLMYRSRSAWWLKDWPERIMRAAGEYLAQWPEYSRWLDWPRAQIKSVR